MLRTVAAAPDIHLTHFLRGGRRDTRSWRRGRDQVRGNAVRDGLVKSGTPTFFVTARLEDEADCRSVIAEAEGNFGRVDVRGPVVLMR